MITIATITQAKLGLSAAERQELERLRQVVASIPAQIDKSVKAATHDAAIEIAALKADIMVMEKEVIEGQGLNWGYKDNGITYGGNSGWK